MFTTVAICTLNRAESLGRTLRSLTEMRRHRDLDWELVVVNNNCSDHTEAVIRGFADQLPIRQEFEPQRGLSRARNRAIDAAKGDYIVWTDDDVIVDPDWLPAYVDAFRRWPEAAVFGGPIVPKYEVPLPEWLIEGEPVVRNSVFGGRDFGLAVQPLALDRVPFGPNFAVRAAEQRAHRYNLLLGHAPGQRRRGEDTDAVRRILRSGAIGYWIPEAKVEHCIGPELMTARYLMDAYSTMGEAMAFLNDTGQPRPILFAKLSRKCLWLLAQMARYRYHRLVSPAPVWLRQLVTYAVLKGEIRYEVYTRQ